MDKIYHVFVSSTYEDLKDERKAVSDSIARAGYVPEGMEIFPASSQRQLDFIRSVISRCDYYILIIAGKFGSTLPDGRSYTQAEYEIAIELKIPILAFLHKNVSTLKANAVEDAPDRKEKLSNFRKAIESSSVVDYWQDGSELAARALAALAQEANRNPGTGWIRGNQVASSDLFREIDALRKQNEKLLLDLKHKPTQVQGERIEEAAPISINKELAIRYTVTPSVQNALSPSGPTQRRLKISPKEVLVSTALAYREFNSVRPLVDFIEAKTKPKVSLSRFPDLIKIEAQYLGPLF